MTQVCTLSTPQEAGVVPFRTLSAFRRFCRGAFIGGFLMSVAVASAPAQVDFRFTIEGLAGRSNPTAPDLRSAVESNARAGFEQWTRWCVVSGPRSIEVVVRVENYPTGTGGGYSATSSFVRNAEGLDIFEEGVAAEIRTGTDPNGADPDMIVIIDPVYLRDLLWFDPEPARRVATIAGNRVDAVSFFAHEFGHTLAFNGWGSTQDGSYPGNYRSRFDALTRWDGSHWFYTGPKVRALFGGDVPLSKIANTRTHYGNPAASASPGRDPVLIQGLMNGVAFEYRKRYGVGLLDLAFLRDQELTLDPAITFVAPVPRLSMVDAGHAQISWVAHPLGRYRIEATSEVGRGWREVGADDEAGAAPGIRSFSADLDPAGRGFYRLRLAP